TRGDRPRAGGRIGRRRAPTRWHRSPVGVGEATGGELQVHSRAERAPAPAGGVVHVDRGAGRQRRADAPRPPGRSPQRHRRRPGLGEGPRPPPRIGAGPARARPRPQPPAALLPGRAHSRRRRRDRQGGVRRRGRRRRRARRCCAVTRTPNPKGGAMRRTLVIFLFLPVLLAGAACGRLRHHPGPVAAQPAGWTWRTTADANAGMPAADGAGVASVLNHEEVVLLDHHGARRWEVTPGMELYDTAPLLERDQVVVASEQGLVALDRATGATRWA